MWACNRGEDRSGRATQGSTEREPAQRVGLTSPDSTGGPFLRSGVVYPPGRVQQLGEDLAELERLVVLGERSVELEGVLGALPTGNSASITRAPAAASVLRSSACAHTAPNIPVLAPITAAGLLRRAAPADGREAQSIAFFSAPGIEELYSGVANRSASASEIARRQVVDAASAGACSSSSSNGGMAFSPANVTSSASGGSRAAAARSRRRLWESRPQRARDS